MDAARRLTGSSSFDSAEVNLISASYASQTWKKHEAAVNSLKSFELFKRKELVWPLSVLDLSNFVTWALTEKSLKATTVPT